MPSPTTYALFVLAALALLVERWISGSVVVGLGVATAVAGAHRAKT